MNKKTVISIIGSVALAFNAYRYIKLSAKYTEEEKSLKESKFNDDMKDYQIMTYNANDYNNVVTESKPVMICTITGELTPIVKQKPQKYLQNNPKNIIVDTSKTKIIYVTSFLSANPPIVLDGIKEIPLTDTVKVENIDNFLNLYNKEPCSFNCNYFTINYIDFSKHTLFMYGKKEGNTIYCDALEIDDKSKLISKVLNRKYNNDFLFTYITSVLTAVVTTGLYFFN